MSAISLAALGLVVASIPASASVTSDSGFEVADGNLAVDTTFDWNGFAPTTWTGTAPNRTSTKLTNGWAFTGLEDAQATGSDSAFAGGTKQDDECATVIGAKAPNKDDLKRVYVSTKTVGGDIFLTLAWVRIPQNTTSPSAHIGFEFNQSQTLCGGSSNGLVERTAGDMLIVYDFEGGSTDVPTITLRRWVTSGACEVGSNSPPCWGPSTNLTALGFAEARVNTFGAVTDAIGPSGSESLGTNEFGEAGINLTDAGVFTANQCTAFGKTYAVSRSSGNSATAQMKDLVGPGNINITNCGRVIIHKVTVPSPDPTDTTFNYTTTGGLNPATFSLKDGDTQDYGGTVFAGSYSVTESDPSPAFTLTDLNCDDSVTTNGTTITTDLAARTVSFDLQPSDTVECTYTNTLHQGAIKISKISSKTNAALAGATFSISGPNSYSASVTTGSDGTACVDGLVFGNYTVTETGAPTGYVIDDTTTHTVTVDNNATCSGDPYVGETISFTDTPTADIQVNFRDGGSGETSGTITCDNTTGSGSDAVTSGWDTSRTVTGIHAPTTVTCTIVIDP